MLFAISNVVVGGAEHTGARRVRREVARRLSAHELATERLELAAVNCSFSGVGARLISRYP